MIGLWKYNTATGYWKLERNCDDATAQTWLNIFKRDEPGSTFKLSRSKPKDTPAKDRRARLHRALDRALDMRAKDAQPNAQMLAIPHKYEPTKDGACAVCGGRGPGGAAHNMWREKHGAKDAIEHTRVEPRPGGWTAHAFYEGHASEHRGLPTRKRAELQAARMLKKLVEQAAARPRFKTWKIGPQDLTDARAKDAADVRAMYEQARTPADIAKATREYNRLLDRDEEPFNPGEMAQLKKAAQERVAASNTAQTSAAEARLRMAMEHTKRRPSLFRGKDAHPDVDAIVAAFKKGGRPAAHAEFDRIARTKKLKDYEALMLAEGFKRELKAQGIEP